MAANDLVVLIVVIGGRALVPLTLFRWPFWGALTCMFADGVDTMIQDALGSDILVEPYHQFDKLFDTYYLAVEAFLAWRWHDALARWTAIVLFAARLAGVVVFEVTGARGAFLYLGPNIFENFYIWVSGLRERDPAYRIRGGLQLAAILVFVGAPKLLQEYVMHYREAQTWHFVKENIFQWR